MEKWCVKPGNKEEAFIVGKWFDENWNDIPNSKLYQTDPPLNYYYIYGIRPGDVYYSNPRGTILSFNEFQKQILNKNIEPNYEIY